MRGPAILTSWPVSARPGSSARISRYRPDFVLLLAGQTIVTATGPSESVLLKTGRPAELVMTNSYVTLSEKECNPSHFRALRTSTISCGS